MRPETAKRIVNRAIQTYLKYSNDALYHESTLRALNKMLAKHSIWNHEHGYPNTEFVPSLDNDYKSIRNEMEYISDRFNAEHRLLWLIAGIEGRKF